MFSVSVVTGLCVCIASILKPSTPIFYPLYFRGTGDAASCGGSGREWVGGLKGCMVLSPFCSRFRPCFISLPFQRVPLLCNILHQSTEQTLTTPHVKDYFSGVFSVFVEETDALILVTLAIFSAEQLLGTQRNSYFLLNSTFTVFFLH